MSREVSSSWRETGSVQTWRSEMREQGWGWLILKQKRFTLFSIWGLSLSKETLKYFQILNHVCKLVCSELDTVFKIIHESGIELEETVYPASFYFLIHIHPAYMQSTDPVFPVC